MPEEFLDMPVIGASWFRTSDSPVGEPVGMMFTPRPLIYADDSSSHKGQASMSTSNTHILFGLDRMEDYYVSFKEKRSIHVEAQFEVESFKNSFLDIYDQIGMCDCDQFHTVVAPTITPPDFLKLAQRAQVHESQLVKLAKAIPSMTQLAMKKSMQLARDKLKGLCTTVEVLENKAITLRKEVAALNGPPSSSNPIPSEPAVVPSQPEEPRSPPDDWWVGYESTSEIVSDEELYHS
ncbi:hypothetical protein HAX54_050982 [Datura stramonium]|uniref:Uncharacterized protein n=1 Tax=Datura stramonium TaxID=4076 RepID=A0ABS8WPS2_DATST|nr:hypothetical protein [Datura stramonium]